MLTEFKRECEAASVLPSAALQAGGVHPTLWSKWLSGKVSPTLRNFERARAGLDKLTSSRTAQADAA